MQDIFNRKYQYEDFCSIRWHCTGLEGVHSSHRHSTSVTVMSLHSPSLNVSQSYGTRSRCLDLEPAMSWPEDPSADFPSAFRSSSRVTLLFPPVHPHPLAPLLLSFLE